MMDMFIIHKPCHKQELWAFGMFYELSKNEITSLNVSGKKLRMVWACNSEREVLNSILSTEGGRTGGAEGRSERWRKEAEKNGDTKKELKLGKLRSKCLFLSLVNNPNWKWT